MSSAIPSSNNCSKNDGITLTTYLDIASAIAESTTLPLDVVKIVSEYANEHFAKWALLAKQLKLKQRSFPETCFITPFDENICLKVNEYHSVRSTPCGAEGEPTWEELADRFWSKYVNYNG